MIYVDNAQIRKWGKNWYHLMSDAECDSEIHQFAQKLGLKRSWFHVDHYDVTFPQKLKAIEAGAEPCDTTKMVEIRKSKRELKIAEI